MQEKIEKVEANVAALKKIVDEEQEILAKLFKAAKGYLGGSWKPDGQSDWENWEIKVKVDGFHLLGKDHTVYTTNKQLEPRISVNLYKSIYLYKNTFQNDIIAAEWKTARNHVSLSSVIDVILSELQKKLREAKKQDIQSLHEKVEQVC